jgi:hypothetical protein
LNRSRRSSAALGAALVVTAARLYPAAACEPARIAADDGDLADQWRGELESLVEATRDPSKPWGCPDVTLALRFDGSRVVLRVVRADGSVTERQVDDPEELSPIGKALLARPLAPVPLHVEPDGPARSPVAPETGGADAVVDDDAPRFRIEATGGFRYAGVTDAVLGGAGARGTLALGAWSTALWLRYAALLRSFGASGDEPRLREISIGASGSYRLLDTPVALDLGLDASVVLMEMSAVGSDGDDEDEAGGTEESNEGEDASEAGMVDGRIGLELRMAFPLVSILRGIVALDAELAPAAFAQAERRDDPKLLSAPAYTAGLALGLELGFP